MHRQFELISSNFEQFNELETNKQGASSFVQAKDPNKQLIVINYDKNRAGSIYNRD